MEKIITMQNLRRFAYCNHEICQKPFRGIVLSFFGLGGASMFHEHTEDGMRYAEQGILFLVPYHDPWGWMNRQTVAYVDELIDVLFVEYNLPENFPIVSSGGSMGGLSALVYTAHASRAPIACVANCPVCDLPYHFTEREDLPRTLYSAFATYDSSLEEAMQTASPLHLVSRLPKTTDYHIFHCEEDMAVNKKKHSDRLVEKLKQDHRVEYYEIPGRKHCDLTEEMWEKYRECIVSSVNKPDFSQP